MVPPSPAAACWHRVVRVALPLSHPDAKAIVSLRSTAPRCTGLSPSTRLTAGLAEDSLLSPPLPRLTHGGITGRGTTQPGPRPLGLSANLGVQGSAGRLSSRPACHKPYPKEAQLIPGGSRELESVPHTERQQTMSGWKARSTQEMSGFSEAGPGRLGFCLSMGRGFSPPPSPEGAGTKSSACRPQTRAQGQGETFTCK